MILLADSVGPGISAKEIKLGQTIALTGPVVGMLAPISKAEAAYYDYVNEETSGVNGRKVKFTF